MLTSEGERYAQRRIVIFNSPFRSKKITFFVAHTIPAVMSSHTISGKKFMRSDQL